MTPPTWLYWPAPSGESELWTPANLISAPRAWLKADSGVYDAETGGSLITVGGTAVRRWEDQGGILDNNPVVSAANELRAPTWEPNVLNGKPVIRFRDETYGSPLGCGMRANTTNIYGDNPNRLAFFIVARRNNQHTGLVTYGPSAFVDIENYKPNIGLPSAATPTVGKNPTSYYILNGVVSYHGEYSTGWNVQPLITPETWFIYSHFTHWNVETDGFYQTLRIDGGTFETTSPTRTPTAEIGTATRNFNVGCRSSELVDALDGEIAEVIYCSGQDWSTSTVDRDKIEGYLAWKWGLENNLPTNHPYKNAAPTT